MSVPDRNTLRITRIPIVDNLCGLDRLPPRGFRFTATPVAIQDLGSFPVALTP